MQYYTISITRKQDMHILRQSKIVLHSWQLSASDLPHHHIISKILILILIYSLHFNSSSYCHTRQIPFHAPWPKLRTTQLQPPSPALTHYVLHFCQMPNRNIGSSTHCWKELLHFSFIQSASIIQKERDAKTDRQGFPLSCQEFGASLASTRSTRAAEFSEPIYLSTCKSRIQLCCHCVQGDATQEEVN